VLDQGKLSEYSNWKQTLDLHMDPIDLRMASVRTARDADRRFCFEVITPQFKRIYQATSEEDMSNWITAINNALQSAVEGRDSQSTPPRLWNDAPGRDMGSARARVHHIPDRTAALVRTIATALVGESPLALGHHTAKSSATAMRRTRQNCSSRCGVQTKVTHGVPIVAPARESNGSRSISASCCASNVAASTAHWARTSLKFAH